MMFLWHCELVGFNSAENRKKGIRRREKKTTKFEEKQESI